MSAPRLPKFLADAEDHHQPATVEFARAADARRGLRSLPGESPFASAEEAPPPAPETTPPAAVYEPPPPPAPPPVAQPPRPTELHAKLLAAIEALRMRAERLAEEARADALEIGFMVARRILEKELSTGPDALFSLIRSAIRRAGESRKIVLRMRPEDCAQVELASVEAKRSLTLAQLELVPDGEMSPGDCIVEGDLGIVDGRLATRLGELARAVEPSLDEEVA